MAQPAQVFNLTAAGQVDPAQQGQYSVIDNSAAGNNLGAVGGSGYDTTAPGAIAQSKNKFTNGNIPDCNSIGLTAVMNGVPTRNGAGTATINFKNPA